MAGTRHADDGFRRWARTVLAHRFGGVGARHDAGRAREVYQSSTMGALLDGIYDGEVTIGELLTHGDFGLGTFNELDGEMVILDGVCHHLRADGSVQVAATTDRTPFAAVAHFTPDITIPVTAPATRAEATAVIDTNLRSENLIYGIRITGTFSSVRTRTVRKQTAPYPPLTEATAGQAETDFRDVTGTLAGFRMPAYEQGVSVAGYHLHFVDDARSHGGHALAFRLVAGTMQICTFTDLHLSLPASGPFLDADLTSTNLSERIHQTEGG
ncbi:acetolactate decarboxylase [Dactylosporangium siamense]|uniref:Alpha-acetolactate decarboxylase n=1 Tax=Dactylosporangium siamense TaxID=685454 RepID=A0A919PJ90_9ACTN|nr:acetolactate decarboxylase [Dactylosporangium siamense]GIG45855.1 acetolactate decarboxylase [Dactylosporangium siamense]